MNQTAAANTREMARQYIHDGLLFFSGEEMQRFSIAICRRLAAGRPAAMAALGEDLGLAPARVEALLQGYPASGMDIDADGAVIACGGLSLAETAHIFEIDGRMLHTWCVLDALFLPEIIGKPAILRTRCAGSGDRIEVHLAPDRIISHSPNGVVMSIVGPDRQACRDNLRGAFCQHVLLFRDAPAFHDWARDRDDVAMVSLQEAHEIGVERNASRYPDIRF
ncbi:MAG: organomercurial lyase [Alphaproteobacteria bacterium]